MPEGVPPNARGPQAAAPPQPIAPQPVGPAQQIVPGPANPPAHSNVVQPNVTQPNDAQPNGPGQENGPAGNGVGNGVGNAAGNAAGNAQPNGLAGLPNNPNNGLPGGPDPIVNDANVRFRLSHLAALRGDDFRAAELERVALESISSEERQSLFNDVGHGHERLVPEPEVWGDVHWHYLRAARDRNDPAQAAIHLNELVRLQPHDEEIICDIVPMLKDQNRASDATAMFEGAYARERKNLDADPGDPHAMNNLAWLCARCGERLPEALKLARDAVAASPNDPSFIDTLAEATFRNGNPAEAAKLETHALELQPGDDFMTKQLARFSGKGK
jgi:tetratricopeptide (TPR) repeat protein